MRNQDVQKRIYYKHKTDMNTLIEQLDKLQQKKYETWTETWWVKGSGDEVVERRRLLTDETSDEEREMWNQIQAIIPELDEEELKYLMDNVLGSTTLDETPILMELGRRGDVFAISRLGDIQWLQDICNQGSPIAAWLLFETYERGDEEHDIPIDIELAKKYYDLAGERGFRWYAWEP